MMEIYIVRDVKTYAMRPLYACNNYDDAVRFSRLYNGDEHDVDSVLTLPFVMHEYQPCFTLPTFSDESR